LIITLGAILATVGSVTWILGKQAWDQTEQEDPQKVFALEVIQTVQARLPWVATNGSGTDSIGSKVWSRFQRRK
jgi:hypothetical protein